MPPKKVCLATIGATGVVIASLVAGPAFAAALTPVGTAGTADAAADTSAAAEPTITVLNIRDGGMLVDVQGTPHALVTFKNAGFADVRSRLDVSGHNTVDVRIANDRENVFTVTSYVADGESVEFEWRTDPRDAVVPVDPENPVDPGAPGDYRTTLTVTGFAGDYAQVALSGPAGYNYSATDVSGYWAGGGRFGDAGTANISLYAPEGAVSNYLVHLRDGTDLVESQPLVIERAAVAPVDPGTPVDPEQPGDPGDDRVSHSIGTKGDYTMVELTGPAGYNFGVTNAVGRSVGAGTFAEDGSARVSLESPIDEVSNYTLTLREGYTAVGTHTIAIDRVGDTPEPPVVPDIPAPGEIVVGDIRDGVASVSMTGPFFASFMVRDAAGLYVTGGWFEGFRKTIEVPAPSGVVSTYQVTISGIADPIEFTVDAR